MKELTSFEGLQCANCGTPLEGEFCHHCGQSVHSVLKPIHAMGEEAFETLFHIDGRIVHTLPALFLKPGFLTMEYFSGRRVRYIAPFRLMFVLSLLAFFVLHLATDMAAHRGDVVNVVPVKMSNVNQFKDAKTPAEVREQLEDGLAALEVARQFGSAATIKTLSGAEVALRQNANARLAVLNASPASTNSTVAPASSASVSGAKSTRDSDDDDVSDAQMKPIHISWLPNVVNARLIATRQRLLATWHAFKHGDEATKQEIEEREISNTFTELPPTMFVLVPVFAALLSVFYVFKRRLYMEHLITALHSHAFLFLSLLLICLTGLLSTWLRPHFAPGGYVIGWIQAALILWIPVYLLMMQKRVYRQGWPMTLVKYWFIGWFYFWLLMFAFVIAVILGLTR